MAVRDDISLEPFGDLSEEQKFEFTKDLLISLRRKRIIFNLCSCPIPHVEVRFPPNYFDPLNRKEQVDYALHAIYAHLEPYIKRILLEELAK